MIYGRAGGWSAAALDHLRRRFAAWKAASPSDVSALVQRCTEIRRLLAEMERQVAGLEAEVASRGQRDGR